VRVFGAAARCGDVLAAPERYPLGADAVCQASEVDVSRSCLIAYDVFSAEGGTLHLQDIPAGQRTVFVASLDGSGAPARGCAAVTAGKTTRLSLHLETGTLRLMVRPWARVAIDGKTLGDTPLLAQELYEGLHHVATTKARAHPLPLRTRCANHQWCPPTSTHA